MLKNILKKYWPPILLLLIICIFFSKLFFPPSILINPDYGRSDFMHFFIPTRMAASESLKKLQLPLWEPKIGNGFPLFDEGQTGFFYLPNILTYYFLPFWLAFNLGYILTFFISALGTYFFARSYKLAKTPSFFAAITFAFCPIFTLHLHHYSLIQTASLIPWIFWSVNSFFGTRKYIYLLVFPFLLSQQHLAGFPQFTIYTLIVVSIFFILKSQIIFKSKLQTTKLLIIFTALIMLGTLIASIQLAATFRLAKNSNRLNTNQQKILTDFPFLPKNLLTVINPYVLGDPRIGTYPKWNPEKWGIFWEDNTYFGIIQFFVISTFIFYLFRKNFRIKSRKDLSILIAIGIISLMLALGLYAPLHPLLSIPPISSFRVPSRFILYSFLVVAILCAFALHKITTKRKNKMSLIVPFICLIAVLDIFRTWSNYSIVTKKDIFFEEPEIVKNIHTDARFITFNENAPWNKIFFENGWKNQEENYLFFRNFFAPNINIIYKKFQFLVYAGMSPKRNQVLELLTKSYTSVNNQELTIDKPSQILMNMYHVGYLTSPYQLSSKDWQYVTKNTKEDQTVFLYKNISALPHLYMVNDYKLANNSDDFANIVSEDSFDERKSTILEEPLENFQKEADPTKSSLSITNYSNTHFSIETNTDKKSILIISDSYDPAWEAKIDEKLTTVYPANINSRAVIIDKGLHKVEFRYERKDLQRAGILSILSLLLSIFLFIKFKDSKIN